MIHKTAIIDKKAKLGKNVGVGPNTIIGPNVNIADNTKIGANCLIDGHTSIGKECEIFTGAIVGSITQDKKYKGGKNFLKIGDRNRIREYVTINLSTDEQSKTTIGNDNLIMAYAHIAHDCKIGNSTTLANCATLAGHVIVEDRVIMGGLAGAHQFVRIGTLAIIGGLSKVVKDIIPYSISDGHPAKIYGVNTIGLERAGIDPKIKSELKKAFRILLSTSLNAKKATEKIKEEIPSCAEVDNLIKFVDSSERGIARGQ